MTDSSATQSFPVTVDNPDAWNDIAKAIEEQSSRPPSANLETVTEFIAASVQLLIDADNAHNAERLRGRFSDQVIAQLMKFSGNLTGCTAKSVELFLIGAPPTKGDAVVRVRVMATISDSSHQISEREQFWDIEIGAINVVTGAESCPKCGAPLSPGALVCPYCHADTQVVVQAPLLVVKLQRMA